MATVTFKQLPNGQWGVRIPTQIQEDYATCDLEPGTPCQVSKQDGSIVEVSLRKHLGHHSLGCVYSIERGSRIVRPAPKTTTLRDLWEESQ